MLIKQLIGIIVVAYVVSMNNPTYSWFTSEISAKGSITNATTDSLIEIGSIEVNYGEGIIQIQIPVTNIASLGIPISVDGTEVIVNPSETYTFLVEKEIYGDEQDISVQLTGFQNFIDEQITIPIDATEMITSGSAITVE